MHALFSIFLLYMPSIEVARHVLSYLAGVF